MKNTTNVSCDRMPNLRKVLIVLGHLNAVINKTCVSRKNCRLKFLNRFSVDHTIISCVTNTNTSGLTARCFSLKKKIKICLSLSSVGL